MAGQEKIQPCLALVYLSAATRLERKKPSTDLTNAPATLRRQEAFKSCFSSLLLVKNPIQSTRMAHRGLSRPETGKTMRAVEQAGFAARIIDHQIGKFDRQVFGLALRQINQNIRHFRRLVGKINSGDNIRLVFFFGQCSSFLSDAVSDKV